MTGFFRLFMYIFGGLAPLAQLAAHRWPLGTGVSDAEVQAGATIMLVFVIAWDVGRWYADRAKPPRAPTRAIRPNRIAAIAVFAVAAAVYEVYRIGGVGSLFTSRERLGRLIGGESLGSSVAPIHGALLGVPVFIAAYLIIAGRKTGKAGSASVANRSVDPAGPSAHEPGEQFPLSARHGGAWVGPDGPAAAPTDAVPVAAARPRLRAGVRV